MSPPQPIPAPDRLIADPDWLLYRIDPVAGFAAFLRVDPDLFRLAPFHDERLRAWLDQQPTTIPLNALLEAADRHSRRDSPGIILHTAFCCSTLLTRLLESAATVYPVREPLVLRDMAMARVQSNFRHALDRQLVSLLSAVPDGYSSVVIKPSNVVNPLADALMQWLPDARFLVMTDSLEAFLLSVLKKNPETQRKMRGMAHYFLRAAGLEDRFDPGDGMLQQAASAWAGQRKLLVDSAPRAAWLNAPALLSRDPDVVAGTLRALGLPADEVTRDRVIRSKEWSRHAKTPDSAFGRDSRQAQERAWKRRYHREIASVVATAGERFQDLDLEPPSDCWIEPSSRPGS